METKSYKDIEEESFETGMSNYQLNMILALHEYQPVLKELALILKEFGLLHQASESVLTLILMIDEISQEWGVTE